VVNELESRDSNPDVYRKVIHVDMDAFYTSIEQRDNPHLLGKPVVVGGSGKRSVVAAASYDARKYGIFSAMPMAVAQRKCNHLIILPPRFDQYRKVSVVIREIFNQFTHLVEPLSLDEAFLDVTVNKFDERSATVLARRIKRRIFEETKLSCSAGVSINKFLAKMASGMSKPDGLTIIKPDEIDTFVSTLPIERFFGIGQATSSKMKKMGIFTGADLQKLSEAELVRHFGKNGRYYSQISRGIDERPVEPHRIRKSLSVERTYEEDLTGEEEIKEALRHLSRLLYNSIESRGIKGRTISLKVRYPDFTTLNRSITSGDFVCEQQAIYDAVIHLLSTLPDRKIEFRLLGIGLSNLNTESEFQQLSLDLQGYDRF
jgi:DNA polymerase-4